MPINTRNTTRSGSTNSQPERWSRIRFFEGRLPWAFVILLAADDEFMYIPPKEYIVKLLNETHYIAQGAAGENWRKRLYVHRAVNMKPSHAMTGPEKFITSRTGALYGFQARIFLPHATAFRASFPHPAASQ